MVAPRFVRSRSLLLVSTASLCMDATAKRTASPVRVPLYAFASVRIVCCVRDPPSVGVSLRVFGEATEPQRRCLPGSRLFPFFSYFFLFPLRPLSKRRPRGFTIVRGAITMFLRGSPTRAAGGHGFVRRQMCYFFSLSAP